MSKALWYSEEGGFFNDLYLLEHGERLESWADEETEFIARALRCNAGARILDVPVGHGRHAVRLAQRGYHVTGIDLNRKFLEHARSKAEQYGVRLRLMHSDMRRLTFREEFDAAFNFYTSIGYFEDDEGDSEFVARVSRALRRGGRFLIDTVNPEWRLAHIQDRVEHELSNGLCSISEHRYDAVSKRIVERRTLRNSEGMETSLTTTSLRLYSSHELQVICEDQGFRLEETYGNILGKPISPESRRMVLVLSKL